MSDWVCYLITSLDSTQTYIGSSNNFPKRLNNHNNNNPHIKRVGAKRTRGQTWIPILIISGFETKISCLSFEAGWKRLAKKRNNKRLFFINIMAQCNLKYDKDPRWNRLMDLIYFVHHFTYTDEKFRLNQNFIYPIFLSNILKINILYEYWIHELPWPFFIDI